MISLTKIFRFEAAHAIFGYNGACSRLHGHSYELHVCIKAKDDVNDYIGNTGMILDLKILKKLVQDSVLSILDHKTLLSKQYLTEKNLSVSSEELVVFPAEPTVENILLFIKNKIESSFPEDVQLLSLKLYETRDSMAEWERG